MSSANKGRKRVVFRLTAPEAKEVCISGSFNGWDNRKGFMKRKPGGFWEKIVMLPPGRYEYKFRVDGNWWLDPGNSQSCGNPFGGQNSVIEVTAPLPVARGKSRQVQARL
ncbi:MAG: glycogen-binding domain-containing protein [Desulfobacteraceae bacterium]|nr:glycogen-binding domain-containing protein [Desulfobacteraceae bacterium]